MIGTCEDCERDGLPLRFKPDVPVSRQSSPSVCDECAHRREELVESPEYQRDRHDPVPSTYQEYAERLETDLEDPTEGSER